MAYSFVCERLSMHSIVARSEAGAAWGLERKLLRRQMHALQEGRLSDGAQTTERGRL